MKNISDHDLSRFDEAWQDKLPEPKVRNLLKRTLEDLLVACERLNQNSRNSSRPPGSMPPWLSGDNQTKIADEALLYKQDEHEDEDAGRTRKPQGGEIIALATAKDTKPASGNNAASVATGDMPASAAAPAAKRAGRPLGAPGRGRTQKFKPTKFVHKHPQVCTGCLDSFTADDSAQAWTAWGTLRCLRAPSSPTLQACS